MKLKVIFLIIFLGQVAAAQIHFSSQNQNDLPEFYLKIGGKVHTLDKGARPESFYSPSFLRGNPCAKKFADLMNEIVPTVKSDLTKKTASLGHDRTVALRFEIARSEVHPTQWTLEIYMERKGTYLQGEDRIIFCDTNKHPVALTFERSRAKDGSSAPISPNQFAIRYINNVLYTQVTQTGIYKNGFNADQDIGPGPASDK